LDVRAPRRGERRRRALSPAMDLAATQAWVDMYASACAARGSASRCDYLQLVENFITKLETQPPATTHAFASAARMARSASPMAPCKTLTGHFAKMLAGYTALPHLGCKTTLQHPLLVV
jgi:hypothetical protein